MPWEGANGLLPGRGGRSLSPPRPRGMPWDVAKGLLPGRGPPGRGAEPPWRAGAGRGSRSFSLRCGPCAGLDARGRCGRRSSGSRCGAVCRQRARGQPERRRSRCGRGAGAAAAELLEPVLPEPSELRGPARCGRDGLPPGWRVPWGLPRGLRTSKLPGRRGMRCGVSSQRGPQWLKRQSERIRPVPAVWLLHLWK